MMRTVIFDGDDTLWKTQPIYKSVVDDFYDILVQQGFASEEFQPLFNSINLDLLKKIKLSTDRLGRAMVSTYETMCNRKAVQYQVSISEQLRYLARQIYERMPVIFDDAHDTLSTLVHNNFQLIFYSGGDENTQRNRLVKLGLDKYFQERIFVVTKKDEETLKNILKKAELTPTSTWMVGNSPKFDINPAVRTGVNCIWLYTSFWKTELEDIIDQRVFVAFSLKEVERILLPESSLSEQVYIPPDKQAESFRNELLAQQEKNALWVVGSSPKHDVNPALSAGINTIWMPLEFGINDIEPFRGPLFVGFSKEGAKSIIQRWAKNNVDTKVIWHLSEPDGAPGETLIVD